MSILTQSHARPTLPELLPVFQELLPSSLLYEWLATSGKRFYRRLFTPLVTLWGVIFQRLNADHIEPRAVRRRPAVYPNLKGFRAEARRTLIAQMPEAMES